MLRKRLMPYSRQLLTREDCAAVQKVLRSDLLTQGNRVAEFEVALASYTGCRYAVVFSSGTAALHAAYSVSGFSQGHEVIVPPITFLATANASLYVGARPVFADVEQDSGNMDASLIEGYISKKTRGIVPVHFAGHPCDMKKIYLVARKHGLIIIEDASHALGAEYRGKAIGHGQYSDMTIISFHPVKPITTGEGGAVLTNAKPYYEKLMMFRQHGVTRDARKYQSRDMKDVPWYYEMQDLGYNYRLTDFQCALGVSQLKKIERFIQTRRETAALYNRSWAGNPYFDLPWEQEYAKSSWHLYPIRLKSPDLRMKKVIFNALRQNGFGVQVHYIPVYWQPYYQRLGYRKGICPKAEDFYAREISVPLFACMSPAQKKQVVNMIRIFKEIIRR